MPHRFPCAKIRGLVAVAIGIVGWIERYLTVGPAFAITAGLLAL